MPNHSFANYVCQFGAGAVDAPAIYLSTDKTTGPYRSAANEWALTVSGVQKFKFSATALMVPAGSAGACAINFGTAGTGLYGSSTTVDISTAGSNRATIDSAGLAVAGIITATSSGASSSFRCTTYRNSGTQSSYYLYNARGTSTTPANLQLGDENGSLNFRAWQTGTTFTTNGLIRYLTTEAHSATALGCKCQIYTTPNTTASPGLAVEIGHDKSLIGYGSITATAGLGVWNATPPASKPAITGDISAYNETTLKALFTALASYGLITDSTTT